MQQTRRARLRQGALSWGLFRDPAMPGRYVEYFVDETWVEHLRRLERFTAVRRRRCASGAWPSTSATSRRACSASRIARAGAWRLAAASPT